MNARYRFEPERSRFSVQAFAAGMLSFLAHSPTFAVRAFGGTLHFDTERRHGDGLDLTITAEALELLDRVKAADRQEIETRMRREVLATDRHPTIQYHAGGFDGERTGDGLYRLHVAGRLALHGVEQAHAVDGQLLVAADGIRLRGETMLHMADYRIRPVTALGGTIKLKDDLRIAFDLIGLAEGS